ncbi:hydroxylase [uncultured Paraglaciecola sp.]|uniref:hydroxylase n=1 Tax=uncultured Paraglaciecola sp. TaxID=1765024 RepID=UPI0026254BBE|nr:hydroxylase [uncultured Paraglaciecola sp.]
MQIHYLEIVTSDVDEVCETYSKLHAVTFGESDMNLGGARVAEFSNGGKVGVRSPLRETEKPIVRHYILVNDIQATVDAASKSGAEIAVPPMELLGYGQCAIVIHNGIETGFWQL